jgi:hypothetical protein
MSPTVGDHDCDNNGWVHPAPISIDGTHLAESSVEGSIPSPRCRHHVDRHRTTGTAGRLRIAVPVEETSGVDQRPEAPACT